MYENKEDSVPVHIKKETEDFENIIKNKLNHKLAINSSCLSCKISDDIVNKERLKGKIVEAECKGVLGKHFSILNKNDQTQYREGDYIIVNYEEDSVDISKILEIGDAALIKQVNLCNEDELIHIVRKATQNDIAQYKLNLNDELKARPIFEKCVKKYELEMKLVDLHYKFDRKKLYFFYTAEGRVDFRELAKELAANFKTRIELRQIGVRDEAKKVGGVGTCGREFCCKLFLNNFKRITTQIASDQNLATNMSKLSGPCGKLKCCLSFEHVEDRGEELSIVANAKVANVEVKD